ncbi:MAG: rhombosortase [Cocleimonas sp.]|nr:rhombosortase [Cocleimonas sp.]
MITKPLKPLILNILAFSIIIIVFQFFQSDLVFYRENINTGQWWRIISGNFVHSNYPHLFMNLAGLWVFGFLFIDSLPLKTFFASILLLSLSVGFGLYFFDLNLQKYYGFSGILYGLFLVGASTAIFKKDYLAGIAVAIVIIAKIIWDLLNGGSPSSAELIGIPVAVHAHLYGALGAIAISSILYILNKNTPP